MTADHDEIGLRLDETADVVRGAMDLWQQQHAEIIRRLDALDKIPARAFTQREVQALQSIKPYIDEITAEAEYSHAWKLILKRKKETIITLAALAAATALLWQQIKTAVRAALGI